MLKYLNSLLVHFPLVNVNFDYHFEKNQTHHESSENKNDRNVTRIVKS